MTAAWSLLHHWAGEEHVRMEMTQSWEERNDVQVEAAGTPLG